MKQCKKCKEKKSTEEFYWIKAKKQFYSYCKTCCISRTKAWGLKNPDRVKTNNRKKDLKNYGLTLDQYNELFNKQDGKCVICFKKVKLVVDHNHKTNVVRGLLCSNCNILLGHAKDDITLLMNAVEYLKKFV